jgi:hypothetical protein
VNFFATFFEWIENQHQICIFIPLIPRGGDEKREPRDRLENHNGDREECCKNIGERAQGGERETRRKAWNYIGREVKKQ